jgi:hypothetical protein
MGFYRAWVGSDVGFLRVMTNHYGSFFLAQVCCLPVFVAVIERIMEF